MTAKEQLPRETPGWSERDAEVALRAVRSEHDGDGADEWGDISKLHDGTFGESMRRLAEEEHAGGQEPW